MTIKPFYDSPRPTRGHHFSDLLTCPERAWLHYYANPKDQVRDPLYLRTLQQEGFEHERVIYELFFPDAVRIPVLRNSAERYRLTVEAMQNGATAILQGYIHTDDGVGVLDILEKIGPDETSKTGYIYRVGEIKRSATLQTAHVFQAAWYTELLERTQGQIIHEACFFLKSGERNYVDLRSTQADYEKAKAELFELRSTRLDPGPHLLKTCPSCHWRGVCMPDLIVNRHVSLVPGISRRQAATLRDMGVITWKDLSDMSDTALKALGMDEFDIAQVQAAVECLKEGTPPLRQPLRSDAFHNLKVLVLEFPELAEQRRAGLRPVPSAIHYEDGSGQIRRIDVVSENGVQTADLAPLSNNKQLAFYGATDRNTFMQIARQSGYRSFKGLDIFSIVDTFIHTPAPGLELEALFAYIVNKQVQQLSGSKRVKAVREVIRWISRSV